MPKKALYYPKLSNKNKKAVDECMNYVHSEISRNPETKKGYKSNITKILFLIKKDFDIIKLEDIIGCSTEFEDTSWEIAKQKFKVFLIYHKRKKLANMIKLNQRNLVQHKVLAEDSLTKEEINKLINTPESLWERALIESYIITGGRRKDISRLRYKDVLIEDIFIIFKVNKQQRNTNKTTTRDIVTISDPNNPASIYPKNLINFIHTHHYKKDIDKPLFYSRSYWKSKKGEFLSPSSINKIIKRIAKESGIKKRITTHIIRHTSATYDGLNLPVPVFCYKYGWSTNSPEVERYCKPTKQMMKDILIKNAGIKEIQTNKCPKCETINHLKAEKCNKCDTPLGKKLIEKLYNSQQEKKNIISKYSETIKLNTSLKTEIKNQRLITDRLRKELNKVKYKQEKMVTLKDMKKITKIITESLKKETSTKT